MRQERALRRAGRAAGVDQDAGVVGRGVDRLRRLARGRQQGLPVGVAAALGAADRDQRRQLRAERPRLEHVVDAGLVDQSEAGAAVVDAVLERVGAEQHRQRHGDRAQPIERDVRHRGLEALRHDDRHPVAACDAERLQGRGQAVGGAVELAVAVVAPRAVLALVADGNRLGGLPRPAGAADLGDVEALGHLPAKAGMQLVVPVDAGLGIASLRAVGREGVAGDAADPPVGHHGRAHALVEADRVHVPVEHAPFEPAAAALGGKLGQAGEQRLADAAAAQARARQTGPRDRAPAWQGRSRSW